MDKISTIAIVRQGHVTVEVPGCDGAQVEVIVIPRPTVIDVEALLKEAEEIRAEKAAVAPDPATLKKWIEQGRP